MNKPHHTRTTFRFTSEQAHRFLKVVKGDPLEALYVLALTTGMRRGELLALQWEDINFEKRYILVHHLLSHRPGGRYSTQALVPGKHLRDIPLMSMAIEALKRHQAQQRTEQQLAGSLWDDHGLVFATSNGSILDSTHLARSFRPLVIKAGLPQVRFHDLRNGTILLLAMAGVPISVIAELLGHKVFSSLKILSPISSAMREEAIARLEAALRTHEIRQE
jgi:integrase